MGRSIEEDNARTAASKLSAAEFDRKAERHFQSHPELKAGRDFRSNTMRFQVVGKSVGKRFDETFEESPDSPGWWDKKYCETCDRVHAMCRCVYQNTFARDPEHACEDPNCDGVHPLTCR